MKQAMLTATAYDTHVEQLFDRVRQLDAVLTSAGVPYRLAGGLAVFFHVSERDRIRARLTEDVDAAIERSRLPAVIEAAKKPVGSTSKRRASACWWTHSNRKRDPRCVSYFARYPLRRPL
jgi:hypothetical protein